MSWSKREIILQALEEIGIHKYEYDSTAEDLQNAQRILDSMMGGWINSGIIFEPQYPLTTNLSATNIDDDTNAPFEAIETMYLLLAIRLAPGYGKTVNRDTKLDAKVSYTGLLRNYVKGFEQSLGRFIRGAAAKRPLYPWNNTQLETQAELAMAAENKAVNVTLEDVLDFYVSLNVEGALAEIGPKLINAPLQVFADNAAAKAAGLGNAEFYRIGDTVAIVHD